jgi:cytochrome c5
MSGADHHHDPIEDNIETHPVKLAVGIAVGAVAVVIGIILMAQLAVGLYGSRVMKNDAAMAPAAVAKRIAPVAKLEVDPNAPAPTAAAASAPVAAAPVVAAAAIPAPAAKAAGGASDGKATYDTTCHVCHGAGVAGAPKFGDKAAWAPRIKQGKAALYNSALKGKGAMPAKGGNAALSDDAVKAAVDYMATAAK